MKLFKKVIFPLVLSSVMLLSACSSSNSMESLASDSTTAEITTSASLNATEHLEKSAVAATTANVTIEPTSTSTEQTTTTITTSEVASVTTSGAKPSNEKMYVHFIDQTTPNMIQGLKGIFERNALISRGYSLF